MKNNDGFLTAVAQFLAPQQIDQAPENLSHYGQDWSGVFTPNTNAILFPSNTEQVSQILKAATTHRQPIVPSGGRTGLSGGAVATKGEVVLSLEKLNHIGPLKEDSFTLEVGAGAITQAVHEYCAPHGLTWPVDFASKGSSQVGGNISTNAGGVRVLRYGSTRNWVLGLTAVTMDGTIHHLNGALEKNNTGVDFRQLLIGSEGILGVITEATLKLCPIPQSRLVFFFALSDFSAVIKLFEFARKKIPQLSAFECMDAKCYTVTTQHLNIAPPFTATGSAIASNAATGTTMNAAKAYALIEVQNASYEEAEVWLSEIFEQNLVLDGVMAKSETEAELLWKIREGIAESIFAASTVHQEDVSVPLVHLESFYADIEARYQKTYPDLEVFFFGHIGDGNLHIFIRKPDALTAAQFLEFAHESDLKLFEVLAKYHGSVSAEHGIGLLKKHALHFSRTPLEIELFKKIKKIFDPQNLLNPGKII